MYARIPVKLRPEGFGDRCSDTTGQRAVGYSCKINKIIFLGTSDGGWVAMLVVPPFESRHLSKNNNGQHKHNTDQHTQARKKIYKEFKLVLVMVHQNIR
jgi:hypothetical protein